MGLDTESMAPPMCRCRHDLRSESKETYAMPLLLRGIVRIRDASAKVEPGLESGAINWIVGRAAHRCSKCWDGTSTLPCRPRRLRHTFRRQMAAWWISCGRAHTSCPTCTAAILETRQQTQNESQPRACPGPESDGPEMDFRIPNLETRP